MNRGMSEHSSLQRRWSEITLMVRVTPFLHVPVEDECAPAHLCGGLKKCPQRKRGKWVTVYHAPVLVREHLRGSLKFAESVETLSRAADSIIRGGGAAPFFSNQNYQILAFGVLTGPGFYGVWGLTVLSSAAVHQHTRHRERQRRWPGSERKMDTV